MRTFFQAMAQRNRLRAAGGRAGVRGIFKGWCQCGPHEKRYRTAAVQYASRGVTIWTQLCRAVKRANRLSALHGSCHLNVVGFAAASPCRRTPYVVPYNSKIIRYIFGAVLGFGLVAAQAAEPGSKDAMATAESWPMFRGNPGLTGVSPAKLPKDLKLLWTYKTGGPVKSSAAIAHGKVFIGSDDKQLHCIDLRTGQKVWTISTEGEIESSPLVLDGLVFKTSEQGRYYGPMVYVGSADGGLYAVDAETGKAMWNFKTDDKILGGPNWVNAPDGKSKWVLAGSYDYRLYCFDALTGKTNWTYETGNYINGTPAVADGKTVFGGCDALLHVISLKDGQKVKEVDAGAYIAGSGAYEGNKFYVGHYENEFLCADLEKGAIDWKFKDRAFPYFSSPALTADRVIFGGRDKRLHCVKKDTGEEVWAFQTRGKVDSSPVVVGDKVVVGSEDGNLYMVGLNDGKEIWKYEIGQAVTSSPAVVDGVVVVGSEDGNVYAFGGKE